MSAFERPKFASATHVGGGASRKRDLNQDKSLIAVLPDGTLIYAVFDGHGVNGHTIAENALKMTFTYLSENIENLKMNPKETLFNLFKELHSSTPSFGGGTSATIAVVIENVLHIVNVGDSTAYLISPNGNLSTDLYVDHEDISGKPINEVQSPFFMQITNDHSPEDLHEFHLTQMRNNDLPHMKKIEHVFDAKPNLRVERFPIFKPVILPTKISEVIYIKNISGDFATLVQNNRECALAFTRSLGDKSIDLERSPTYSAIKLIPGVCLIMASDGLWDNTVVEGIRGFNFVEFIIQQLSSPEPDAEKIAQSIIAENEKHALNNFGSSRDNVVCVIALI